MNVTFWIYTRVIVIANNTISSIDVVCISWKCIEIIDKEQKRKDYQNINELQMTFFYLFLSLIYEILIRRNNNIQYCGMELSISLADTVGHLYRSNTFIEHLRRLTNVRSKHLRRL